MFASSVTAVLSSGNTAAVGAAVTLSVTTNGPRRVALVDDMCSIVNVTIRGNCASDMILQGE